jgi:hypothetical protein
MIRRDDTFGFILHAQADHAVFAGILAAHVGNGTFAKLSAAVVAAVAAHDAGWPLHDDEPTLNPRGFPLHVFETPVEVATKIWAASAERAEKLGAYGALLVSLHQLALSDFAMGSGRHSTREVFELNKFQHRQIERQEALRSELGFRTDLPLHLGLAAEGSSAEEDQLRFDFKMLTMCDRLSLELCCGKKLFASIEEMATTPGGPRITMKMGLEEGRVLKLEPWPFDVERISARVPCRRVKGEPFAAVEEYRKAYGAAAVESIVYELVQR